MNIKIYVDTFPVGQTEYTLLSVQSAVFHQQFRYIIVVIN